MDGMMIPFIMLLIVTIALILERKHHEDKIVKVYEEKFEQWKQHSNKEEQEPLKELKGLIFKQGYKVSLELFDDTIEDIIERKKYTIITKDHL
jgi:methionine salvage enolase-phosphatase E1